MTSVLLAIDPGNHAGWSCWLDHRLAGCGCGQAPLVYAQAATVAIIERPEVYEDRKVSTDSIITLAMNAGRRLSGLLPGVSIYGVKPKTWKKQLSKSVHEGMTRAELSLSDLALAVAAEKTIRAALRNNMWDAIALGLWAVKRRDILQSATDYVFPELV